MSRQSDALAAATLGDPRWIAVTIRDPTADGRFFYAVKSTGIYCRPSCGARTPKPGNVTFYLTAEAAGQAGFRPCKRCQPDQPSLAAQHAVQVAALCRLIEVADVAPSLKELASRVQLSPCYLQRIFKSITGVTPKAYALAHRAGKVRDQLLRGGTVTEAIYAAGYNANSRFYEQSNGLLGMTPRNYRAGGANTQIRFAVGECSLGAILVAASERGICAIFLGDDPAALVCDLQDRFPSARLLGGDTRFEQLVAQAVGLVEAPRLGLDLPLDVRGTAFQQRVWQALREIPAGSTASYTEIARRIGAPRSVRAVAGACAANCLAVAIPCHRVIRTDGGLAGYHWGIERKRVLLERESGGPAGDDE